MAIRYIPQKYQETVQMLFQFFSQWENAIFGNQPI